MQSALERARTPDKVAELERDLAGPPMPEGALYLWVIFRRLSSRRGNNGFGGLPLTYPEIEAFDRLSGARLEPWEIEIIEHLDGLYLEAQIKAASTETP
jgi:hypothetical protein